MGLEIVTGVLAGLLVASLLGNVIQFIAIKGVARASAAYISDANARLDAMLGRIATAEHIELREPAPPKPDLSTKPYISDHPYDDDHWNDFVHEPEPES